MNRSLANVLFGGIAAPTQSDHKFEGQITKTTVEEVVDSLENAESVIIVGGVLHPAPSRFHVTLSESARLLATVWQLQRRNMRSPKSLRCCGPKESRSDSRYILSLEECPDNVMSSLLRRLYLMIVGTPFLHSPCLRAIA